MAKPTENAQQAAETPVAMLAETERMPWMVALRLEALKIARDTARYKALDALEPEAERYVNWVLRTPTPPRNPVEDAGSEAGGA